ncbi:zinc finger MYM-type protein 1-like [Panicum virgatum]|uniref:zinc finger MYM-type protein 1-like n=2 Tax=Panicum virgatum TaxID=38727 RepID=UPI0019D53168|nr:zinc finger MYM-type protein 1-like [Panicum virgatum]
MNQKTNVGRKLVQISKEEEKRYEIRLTASLGVARFLIMQGDAFRGHDESSTSLNKGTYREMIDWYKDKVEIVKEAYEKGSKNCQMLSPDIQKDLTKACAEEVTSVIMDEIRGKKFSVLIDESRDVSIKEQMAVILRFVNDEGKVMERFLGLQHVQSCTAIALKEALVRMLSSHNLSISMLRGQGYDGASNMRGEFNGVQKLIRDENPYAFYVHCFAHQLQLVVVTISTSSADIADFFNYVPLIVNNVGASCMRKDALLAKHHDVLLEKIENGEIMTGRGLNQESSLARPGDTRWGSHLKTLLRILVMWEAIIDVLEIVKKDSIKPACNGALGLIGKMESFDFVFILHLMIELLSMIDILSRALQRKDQDIVEAMHLIMDVKDGLQDMRENRWEPLLKKVKTLCERNEIEVPDMNDEINVRGTSRRRKQKVTNMHYYHVEIFLVAIDAILTELNHRFSETSSELLVCMACFNPRKSFSNFDVDKLVRLAEIYAEDFDIGDLTVLPNELKSFVNRARRTPEFLGCTELGKVAEIMVKTNMNTSYQRVYRLIELTLILPVATASVERIFSAMSIIKTDLRSKMGDEWLNDLMICYNEKEIFRKICNEKIKKRFEEMKKRRMLLPKKLMIASSDE